MMIKYLVFSFLVGLGGLAKANLAEPPVEVIKSAELQKLTSPSMVYESRQYQSVAEWNFAAESLKTKQLEKELQKGELDRARKLHERGVITDSQLDEAEWSYDLAVSKVEVARARLLKTTSEIKVQQLLMLAEGSPEEDYRVEMAQTLVEKAQSERQLLTSQRSGAVRTLQYFESQLEVTRKLWEKRLRTKSQLEAWKLRVRNQKELLARLDHQVESTRLAERGAKQALERLQES